MLCREGQKRRRKQQQQHKGSPLCLQAQRQSYPRKMHVSSCKSRSISSIVAKCILKIIFSSSISSSDKYLQLQLSNRGSGDMRQATPRSCQSARWCVQPRGVWRLNATDASGQQEGLELNVDGFQSALARLHRRRRCCCCRGAIRDGVAAARCCSHCPSTSTSLCWPLITRV